MAERFTAQYWRDRAEEARTVAEQMRDPATRRMMLSIATGYEWMADRKEALDREKLPDQNSN